MNVHEAVLLAQAGALTAVSLLLLYPVVRYARNIAYTEAFVSLTAGFVTLTASYLADLAGAPFVSRVLELAAALAVFVGVLLFAKPFVRLDRGDLTEESPPPVSTGEGGFTDDN
ncbi:hypothetical protein [Halobaculum sp. D14]|uniref:hypothetical protein n=1 Tax=unclassified Halobaculum TaxID=2640896 RepID=UPI003EB96ACD